MEEKTNQKRTEEFSFSTPPQKLKYARLMNGYVGLGEDLFAVGENGILFQGYAPKSCAVHCAGLDENARLLIENEVQKRCESRSCAYEGMTADETEQECDSPSLSATFVGERISPPKALTAGDALIGLAANGVHVSGFPTLEKLFSTEDKVLMEAFDKQFLSTAEEELLRPTKRYCDGLTALYKEGLIKRGAAVLENGVTGAVEAILSKGQGAVLQKKSYEVPRLFRVLRLRSGLDEDLAYRTFTMGLGGVLAVEKDKKQLVKARLLESGITAYEIGEITDAGVLVWQ